MLKSNQIECLLDCVAMFQSKFSIIDVLVLDINTEINNAKCGFHKSTVIIPCVPIDTVNSSMRAPSGSHGRAREIP